MKASDWVGVVVFCVISFIGGFAVGGIHNTITVDDARVKQCITEESNYPCIWDAKTQGNKEGQSFYLDAEGRIYPIGEDTP